MAAGAGKTYTACVLSHRLLAHAKFRRVLFLADRANLSARFPHRHSPVAAPAADQQQNLA
jgi:type I site-specific restriction endonuclease